MPTNGATTTTPPSPTGSTSSSQEPWKIFGRTVPKGEVVFFCQVIVILIVIISAIINLSLQNGITEMWISVFAYSLGAILPQPKLKGHNEQLRRRTRSAIL